MVFDKIVNMYVMINEIIENCELFDNNSKLVLPNSLKVWPQSSKLTKCRAGAKFSRGNFSRDFFQLSELYNLCFKFIRKVIYIRSVYGVIFVVS